VGRASPRKPKQTSASALIERQALALTPPDIYALQHIVACSTLYRFGAMYRLDRPDGSGELHPISAAAVCRLDALRLVRVVFGARVFGSPSYVHETEKGFAVARLFGWPTVWREWNEMPVAALGERMAKVAARG